MGQLCWKNYAVGIQRLSQTCFRWCSMSEVGGVWTKAIVLWGFLNTAFYLLLFKFKYCYKTSSVQTSAVSLTLKGSAIL